LFLTVKKIVSSLSITSENKIRLLPRYTNN